MKAILLMYFGLMAGVAIAGQNGSAEAETGEWNFEATLDGRLIGSHRFVVSGAPEARQVRSDAAFVVRVLGIPVYRYRHHAEERWQGDCLRGLRSETNDDGKPAHVDQAFDAECLMAFAYWNPRLVTQRRLVDPQTGRVEPVSVEALPDAQIMSRGQPVPAHGWRLLTAKQRITVWYAADTGRWIALDADAAGGRKLSYRQAPVGTSPSKASP
ncbi:MAG TPA: DUF6134 family protein [Burkholderiaceae bacterium]